MAPVRSLLVAAAAALVVAAGGSAQPPAITESHQLIVRVEGGRLGFHGVAFSPDGSEVFAYSNGHARWKTAGKLLGAVAGRGFSSAGVGYAKDGKTRFAYTTEPGSPGWFGVVVWDAADKELRRVPLGPFRPGKRPPGPRGVGRSPEAVAFTPDGKYALCTTLEEFDKQRDPPAVFLKTSCVLYLYDLQKGTEVRTFQQTHTDLINSLALTPDGKRAATGAGDATARLWDVAAGRELKAFKGHGAAVVAVAVSADGQRVATAADEPGVRVWDAKTGQAVTTYAGHTGSVRALAFTPDGARVLSLDTGGAGGKSEGHLWEAAGGRAVGRFVCPTGSVTALAVSPDGKLAATAGSPESGVVRLWKLPE